MGRLLLQSVPRLPNWRDSNRRAWAGAFQHRGKHPTDHGDRCLYHKCRLCDEAEQDDGSLEAGKRADLIVLDRDMFSIDPETIQDAKVLVTYLDGRVIYSAEENKGAWWDQRR